MKDLYIFIFAKAYYLCINVFKEKEHPQIFASTIITITITVSLSIITSIIEYLSLPNDLSYLSEKYKYFALFTLVVVVLFVQYGKRYKKIIDSYKKMSLRKINNLKVLSIAYFLFIFASSFYFGFLIREYNLQNM